MSLHPPDLTSPYPHVLYPCCKPKFPPRSSSTLDGAMRELVGKWLYLCGSSYSSCPWALSQSAFTETSRLLLNNPTPTDSAEVPFSAPHTRENSLLQTVFDYVILDRGFFSFFHWMQETGNAVQQVGHWSN